jgi:hypothetical protein
MFPSCDISDAHILTHVCATRAIYLYLLGSRAAGLAPKYRVKLRARLIYLHIACTYRRPSARLALRQSRYRLPNATPAPRGWRLCFCRNEVWGSDVAPSAACRRYHLGSRRSKANTNHTIGHETQWPFLPVRLA